MATIEELRHKYVGKLVCRRTNFGQNVGIVSSVHTYAQYRARREEPEDAGLDPILTLIGLDGEQKILWLKEEQFEIYGG